MRFRPLDQRLAKTYFLYFLGRYIVPANVIDPVLGPDELADPHVVILPHDFLLANVGNLPPSYEFVLVAHRSRNCKHENFGCSGFYQRTRAGRDGGSGREDIVD